MKIERQYYTASQKWMDETDNEVRQIQGSMTEEEKQAEREKNEREFKRLVERIERERSGVKQVTDQRKREYFGVLAEAGLALAQIMDADYKAEDDEYCGTIRFRTGPIFLGVPGGPSGRDGLVLLIRMADHIEIIPKGNVQEWTFSFGFYDTFS